MRKNEELTFCLNFNFAASVCVIKTQNIECSLFNLAKIAICKPIILQNITSDKTFFQLSPGHQKLSDAIKSSANNIS